MAEGRTRFTVEELADSLKCGLFAKRDTMLEANAYMQECFEMIPERDRVYAYTGVYVFFNTLADALNAADLQEM